MKQDNLKMSYEWKAASYMLQATSYFGVDEQREACGVRHVAIEVQFSYLYYR
jgi:hypothetical protein